MARLTRGVIVTEALALVDELGLEALTARRLAERLGVQGAALYHHIGDMEDLQAAVVWEVIAPASVGTFEGTTWQEVALARAKVFRSALLAHPNVIPLLSGPLGEHILATRLYHGLSASFEQFLELLEADGIVGDDALIVFDSVEAYTIGSATVGSPHLQMKADRSRPQLLGRRMQELLALQRQDADSRFETGFSSLLDGLSLRLSKRRRTRPGRQPSGSGEVRVGMRKPGDPGHGP